MRYKGLIKDLNHIVISDPSYKDGVWCRYEKDNLNEKNWNADLQIYSVKTKFEDYDIHETEFYLLLQKDKRDCKIDEDGTLRYSVDIQTNDYTLAVDSSCIALGINNKAQEIIDSVDYWQPSCAIKTGSDGIFGEVTEGIKDGQICFLLITGSFDRDFCDEEMLFHYLNEQFEITDFVKEETTKVENDKIDNGNKLAMKFVNKEIPINIEDVKYPTNNIIFDEEVQIEELDDMYNDGRVRVIITKEDDNPYYSVYTYDFEDSTGAGYCTWNFEVSEKEVNNIGGIENLVYEVVTGEQNKFESYGVGGALGKTAKELGFKFSNVAKQEMAEDVINKKYVIKSFDMEETGGRVFVYYGKLENGNWYFHTELDDSIYIYDKKPLDDEYYDDGYEWCNKHLVEVIDNKSAKQLFKTMDSFIDEFASEPNWNYIFHDHLREMINKNNKENDCEI